MSEDSPLAEAFDTCITRALEIIEQGEESDIALNPDKFINCLEKANEEARGLVNLAREIIGGDVLKSIIVDCAQEARSHAAINGVYMTIISHPCFAKCFAQEVAKRAGKSEQNQ